MTDHASSPLLKAFGILRHDMDGRRARGATPTTMEELAVLLGSQGGGATEYATWNAIRGWIGNRPEAKLDPAGTRRLHKAVSLYSESTMAAAGTPSITGYQIEPLYADFHRSRQSRIKRAALEARAHWESAGRPGLESSIAYTYGYMTTALAKAAALPDAD